MLPFPITVESRRAARLIAFAAFCIYIATAGGGLTSIDAVMNYDVTKNLVEHGSTAFDEPGLDQHRGIDGRYYSPFGIGQSLFNIPFYVAGRAARQALGLHIGRSETVEKAAVALGSAVAAAGIIWVMYLFAWRLSGNLVAARRTALALGFGTLVWPYSKFGFSAALTSWFLIAGLYSAWVGVRGDRRTMLAWSGAWLACAFLTRHEMAVPAGLVAVWIAFESRHDFRRLAERLAWLAVPLAAAFALWLWYNFARFGNPLDTGNRGDVDLGFDQPILVGIRGLLFSPGRSLFIYAPLAAIGVLAFPAFARRDRSTAVLFASVSVSLLVLYGSLRYWDGLRSYGPRYLVPLLPILSVPLVWWLEPGTNWWRRTLLWMVALSTIVQLPGVLVDFSKVSVAHAQASGYYSRDAKIYSWSESELVLNTRAAIAAVPANVRNLVHGTRPAGTTLAPDDNDRNFSQRFEFSLDFWWLYLFYLGAISAPVAVALGLTPLVIAAIALMKAWDVRLPHSSATAASV